MFRPGARSLLLKPSSGSLLVKALKKNPVATLVAIAGKSSRGALVAQSGALPQLVSFYPPLQAAIGANPVGSVEQMIRESGEWSDRLQAVFDMGSEEDVDFVAVVAMEEVARQGRAVTTVMALVVTAGLLLFVMFPIPFLAVFKLMTLLK